MKFSKKLVVLCFVALLFISSSIYAVSKMATIKVLYDNIKIVVNGKEVVFGKDLNGNRIEPFVHNGVTYLPVRAVGEALGQEVNWDGDSKTVYVGDNKPVKNEPKIKMMADAIPSFSDTNAYAVNSQDRDTVSLAGIEYKSGFVFSTGLYRNASANFNLEDKYLNITGKLGADKEGTEINVKFIGDGVVLQDYNIISGRLPIDVNLNVSGVHHLKIEVKTQSCVSDLVFADVKIK